MKFLVLIFIAAVVCSCKDNRAKEIPISEFFKTPEKTNFKISPDGKYVAYLKKYNKTQNLFVETLADGSERMITSFANYSVRDYNWMFDGKILLSRDIGNDKHQMMVLDLPTLKTRKILPDTKAYVRIINRSRQTPDIITIAMNDRDSANFDVYRLNIKSGELKPYLVNPGNITDWFSDADGKIRLVKKSDGVDETILFRSSEGAPFKAIIKNNFKNSVRPIGFTGEKNYFYALSNVNRDKMAFVEINAENGKENKVIFSSNKADITRVDYVKSKHRLELAAWDEDKPQKHFLNDDIKAIYDNLAKQLSGNEINIIDRDTAESKFIVTTYTDRNPGSVYLYEKDGDKLTTLGNNSNIKPEDLCAMKPISFRASDGLMISGYLTLPQSDDQTNLPAIVLPHNGPFGARDNWGYNSEVQFLANRGFAVLQVNYRGSSGYGKAFFSAGFKEEGGKIQQDITDGANWLIDTKIANPKKVAIYGQGFGGFCALYGVSFHPQLYNCAVAQNSLISFFTYITRVPAYAKALKQKTVEMVGDPGKDATMLTDISPAFHPDKPKVPLFIFQSTQDKRADIGELERYIRELQKRNVPVMYLKDNVERGSSSGENSRIKRYMGIEKFLDNNMRVKR